MDTPTLDAAPPATPAPTVAAAAPLELVELELALSQRDIAGDRFGSVVREAVAAVGGALLFEMTLDEGGSVRWIAAAAIGDAAAREIVIVELAGRDAPPTVSLACDSALPVAAIAPAYAGLAACWPKAA